MSTTNTADHVAGLLDHHVLHLHESGLQDATIKGAGIYSETSAQKLAAQLNWNRSATRIVPAIVFPYIDALGRNGYCIAKPDRPRVHGGKEIKYEAPKERPNQIYIPPGVAALLDNPATELFITEGPKKALALTQAGFSAISINGIYGYKVKGHAKLLPDLAAVQWQHRKVFIVFDSDIATNENVQQAAAQLGALLKNQGADVGLIVLPEGAADESGKPTKLGADDYLVRHGAVEFRKLADAATEPEPPAPEESKPRADKIEPAAAAKEFLGRHVSDGISHFCFHRGSFKFWSGGRYAELDNPEVEADLIRHINRDYIFLTRTIIGNLMAQLRAQSAIRSSIEMPAWLGDKPIEWPARDVLATPRELIHIPSILSGQPYSVPATPRYFSTFALDYDFEPDPPEPKLWLGFLDQLWGDDRPSIDTLQEWSGYLLTGDTSQQKILGLIGPPRGGKGVICRVLNRLVGPANVCGPTLASFEGQFGLSPLLNKTLAIISDARLSGRVDQSKIVERLLSISGEDVLTSDRKHRDPVTGKISARLMIVSNELPRLSETSGALANRMIVLRSTKDFLGREDTELSEKLYAELSSILWWAIAGWCRLRERGHFVQPDSGKELASEMKDLSSPVGLFLRDCCEVDPAFVSPVDDVYRAWCQWCTANGRDHTGTIQTFGRDLRAVVPLLRITQPRKGDKRFRQYEGVRLGEK